MLPTVQFPPASCYFLFGPDILCTMLLHDNILLRILLLPFVLGPPFCFPSELIRNYGSYRESVGLLGRVISLVGRPPPTQDNGNTEETRTDIHASSGI
jgi:hypothetical protein